MRKFVNRSRRGWSSVEVRMDRMMRGPDGHGTDTGAGENTDSGQSQNNQQGNSASNQSGDSTQNNGGQQFDGSSFWNSPSDDESGAGGNSGTAPNSSQSGGQQEDTGQAFVTRLNGLNFGESIMDSEAASGLSEGKPEKFHSNMQDFGRNIARESVLMSAQLMQTAMGQMEQRFQNMIEARFGQQDAETNLSKEFPSYQQPGMKPMIDGIFSQSMKHTKGNRTEALAMTRDMLKYAGTNVGKDLGLNTPPGGAGDNLPTTDWEAELLGR